MSMTKAIITPRKKSLWRRVWRQRWAYLLLLPALACLAVFAYGPMYGIVLAFKKYTIRGGILGSPWVGFVNFERLFGSAIFWRSVRNTLIISFMNLLLNFPMPIIFALMMNEMIHK